MVRPLVKLTERQMHVYTTLRDHGPLSAAALTRLIYPQAKRYVMPSLGGALGRMKRAGLIGYNVVRNEWFVMPNHGIPLEVRR